MTIRTYVYITHCKAPSVFLSAVSPCILDSTQVCKWLDICAKSARFEKDRQATVRRRPSHSVLQRGPELVRGRKRGDIDSPLAHDKEVCVGNYTNRKLAVISS